VKSCNITFRCQQVTSNNTDSMMQPGPGAVMNSLVSKTKVCNNGSCYHMQLTFCLFCSTILKGGIVRK
jgi:hypothetical protein